MITKIYIGSKNPAKINAVKQVFPDSVHLCPVDVPSSVSAQPFSDDETRLGAKNRATYLVKNMKAPMAIGLEGGVVDTDEGMQLCNWGALATDTGDIYTAGGARIFLPNDLAEEIRLGKELGLVIDQWANAENVRKGQGTIGILTMGEVDRAKMFRHVVELLYGQWKFHERRKERVSTKKQ
ncbi:MULTISPECIES: DUF84 family protein [Bacillaceae]|uniref:inosine/xanthosine triphosphatase n=1 Tax=Evansella alkalicola TaxID=745819 RepID=A0ABS6JTS4_9BACI|nr:MULTISPECIES: DUF84 family protein [Bacillaceae]MBU9721079.1 DUF84 family protein [Bacillus alkalicola]